MEKIAKAHDALLAAVTMRSYDQVRQLLETERDPAALLEMALCLLDVIRGLDSPPVGPN